MPHGKAAGVRCVQLSDDNRCLLFGKPERPAVCVSLCPNAEMCGDSAQSAMIYLSELEIATLPEPEARALRQASSLQVDPEYVANDRIKPTASHAALNSSG